MVRDVLRICISITRDFFRWILRSIPTHLGIAIRLIVYKAFFYRLGRVKFHENVIIDGFKNIQIDDDTFFMQNCSLYADAGRLTVGKRCSFNHNVMLNACHGEVILGDDVIVGPNTVLRAADHNFENFEVPIKEQGHCGGIIIIEDNVWLAANVVITTGVRIGKGSVVGAGSVVTRDVSPGMVVAGVPARPIKHRSES